VRPAILRLIVRIAEENPTCGNATIRGARKSRASSWPIDDCPDRASARDSSRARPADVVVHVRVGVVGRDRRDVFMTDVWTFRGAVTDYTTFVIDLASRRAHIIRLSSASR